MTDVVDGGRWFEIHHRSGAGIWAMVGWLALVLGCETQVSEQNSRLTTRPPALASIDATEAVRSSAAVSPGIPDVKRLDIQGSPVISQKSGDPVSLGADLQCRQCHADQWETFQHSAHRHSFHDFGPVDRRQVDGLLIDHQASRRRYVQTTEAGATLHAESIGLDMDRDGSIDQWMPTAELPVRYVIGSGQMAEGYLLEDGPFLIQSPVTWYSATNTFEMAPGYDGTSHLGMTRSVTQSCLACHTGQTDVIDRSPEKPNVVHQAIGCARCHGDGSVHIAHHLDSVGESTSKANAIVSPVEAAMVHPAEVDRSTSESLCAQCHLEGGVAIEPMDKGVAEFRPGDDINDFRVAFDVPQFEEDGTIQSSGFVGHFDQMYQSACYQQTETMTCVTCHNPHEPLNDQERVAVRRQQCVACHSNGSADECGMAINQRLSTNQNQCALCHMPTTASGVPHSPTTQHRIAVYDSSFDAESKSVVNSLIRQDDFKTGPRRIRRRPTGPLDAGPLDAGLLYAGPLDDMEGERLRLLARTQIAIEPADGGSPTPKVIQRELSQVDRFRSEQKDDPALQTASARLLTQTLILSETSDPTRWREVISRCSQAIATLRKQTTTQQPVSKTEIRALDLLAGALFEIQAFERSAAAYRRLTQIRRNSSDWYNLALSLAKIGQFDAVGKLLGEAIRIDGANPLPYQSLARWYRAGRPRLAIWYETIAHSLPN